LAKYRENGHKKGPPSDCWRPKSREETPKEGGSNASHRATAPQQYVTAPHKKQEEVSIFFVHLCISVPPWEQGKQTTVYDRDHAIGQSSRRLCLD
jgi:hypothetical protein